MLVGAALIASPCIAQTEVPWGRALEWTDFRGRVPAATMHHAYTSYRIRASATRTADGTVAFTVDCLFNRDASWVKREGRGNDALLRHERLHFDIGEVQARLLRAKLAALGPDADPQHAIRNGTNEATQALRDMQDRYDAETRHGVEQAAQGEWAAKIEAMLVELARYAVPAP